MAAAGITSIKSFTYRDNVEEWGNTYHFVGDAPTDLSGWEGLASALFTMEKTILPSTVSIVRAYGYEDTDDDSVVSLITGEAGLPVTGSLSFSSPDVQAPGDAAVWARWKTARVNSNGKAIYLRKYYHGVIITPEGGDGDTVASAQHTPLGTLATNLNTSSGAWPGIAGPDGVAPGVSAVSSYATTRTLRRRGARPH